MCTDNKPELRVVFKHPTSPHNIPHIGIELLGAHMDLAQTTLSLMRIPFVVGVSCGDLGHPGRLSLQLMPGCDTGDEVVVPLRSWIQKIFNQFTVV